MKRTVLILFLALLISPAANAGGKERRFKTYTVLEKGEWMAGLTALYSSVNSNNSQFLLIAENLDANGNILRIAPAVSYAYRDNASVGLRLSYGRAWLKLDNVNLSLMTDDISLDIDKIDASYSSWSAAVFHRNYFGLDRKGTVGLFCEEQFEYAHGNLDSKDASNPGQRFKLTFAPGVILYILPFLSVEFSIGIAEVDYTLAKSPNEGDFSKWGAGVSFNILNSNIGINFHF